MNKNEIAIIMISWDRTVGSIANGKSPQTAYLTEVALLERYVCDLMYFCP